ncbi:hypothetical protein OsI_24077 [Oryza sativa Indica Group]|jgi:hypothetical protein|uniref:Uncharacterized protein n=6 Tax=Oryza TaxID=4527 RepID=Q652I4_ORYSJ|nr:hypothetical protein OsI_24077 [Oryza sativa Indica Group]BAD46006.1 hypothetical protein [Oryza sativa Japonica Group]BAD46283.1 hypothetical protein [Oryza sativa Japonica Group]
MAGAAGNATAAVIIVLAVAAALVASSLAPAADAFRTYFPEDEQLLRNKGSGATVVVMTAPVLSGSPVVTPAGAPSGAELIAFAGRDDVDAEDGAGDGDDVSPGPAPSSAGVISLDSERAAADDVLLP